MSVLVLLVYTFYVYAIYIPRNMHLTCTIASKHKPGINQSEPQGLANLQRINLCVLYMSSNCRLLEDGT